jgi:LmbE family N-acetylglucosaminyl deacetylase
MANVVLSVLAHPDDAEFFCAGTLLRLAQEHGWQVHIASMTPGDCGSAKHGPEDIARIRRAEGTHSAALLGGMYHCLEERDLRIFYDANTLEKVVRLLREVRPQIVITHSPSDYMVDHEMTSLVTRAACFAAPIPNYLSDQEFMVMESIPHLYYCDPPECKDPLGRNIAPGFCLDVTAVMAKKAEMLAAHASQRDWLLKHHGMDHFIESMRQYCAMRGQLLGTPYAEGFRQHLGHSYPQNNLLGELLGRTAGNEHCAS